MRLPWLEAAFEQVAVTRPHSFPAFPYTHAQPAAQPCICLDDIAVHLGKTVVARPATDERGQHLLAPRVTDIPAATCQLLEFRFQS